MNDVNGVILLPDDWSSDTYSLNNTNSSGASFSSNTLTASQWSTLEQTGAVFLSAAGYRDGTSVKNVVSGGAYWSASSGGSWRAYYAAFSSTTLDSQMLFSGRSSGFSVRLVHVAG